MLLFAGGPVVVPADAVRVSDDAYLPARRED